MQNEDSSVSQDYISGLQSPFYSKGRKDADEWRGGQYFSRTPPHQRGKSVPQVEGEFSQFCRFAQEKHKKIAALHSSGKFSTLPSSTKAPMSGSNPPSINEIIVWCPKLGRGMNSRRASRSLPRSIPTCVSTVEHATRAATTVATKALPFLQKRTSPRLSRRIAQDARSVSLSAPSTTASPWCLVEGPYNPDRAVPLGEKFDPAKWAQ